MKAFGCETARESTSRRSQDEDMERLRRAFPQLSSTQITAALIYYKRYPEEIRRQVEASAALTAEALEQRYPGLVRVLTIG